MRIMRVAAMVVSIAAASCYDPVSLAVGPDPLDLLPVIPPTTQPARDDVDILVVVDNSGSMSQEQAALAASFPRLLEDLFDPPDRDGDGRPDGQPIESLNVGVVSTDMGSFGHALSTCASGLWGYAQGDDGCLLHSPRAAGIGCEADYPSFLSNDPTRGPFYPVDELARDFACISALGTNGCGWEQPLKAARRALTEQTLDGGCNHGFLRPHSLVLVLWITDEDDASVSPEHPGILDIGRTDLGHMGDMRVFLHPDWLVPVEEYVEAFRSLESSGDPRVLLAVIAGVPPDEPQCTGFGDGLGGCLYVPAMQQGFADGECCGFSPSCGTAMGYARPPVRFVRLAQAWDARAYVDSVCTSDWAPALGNIAAMVCEPVTTWPCWPELPLDSAVCDGPGCYLIMTRRDDGACPADPSCPAESCPAVSLDDLVAWSVEPCADPATGAACEPLFRDLGLGPPTETGALRRWCLVRQSARVPDGAGGCEGPTSDGWYFVPGAASAHGCPEARLEPWDALWVPFGSALQLRCAAPP